MPSFEIPLISPESHWRRCAQARNNQLPVYSIIRRCCYGLTMVYDLTYVLRGSEMDRALAQFHAQLIKNAQLLFKFSLGISATRPELGYLESFASYRHTANRDELKLTPEHEFEAAGFLEHVATYVLATQIDAALETSYPNRFQSTDQIMRSTSSIARLIRNAFAHNPFAPRWIIDRKFLNKEFAVPGVISLSTAELNGQYVDQAHYGGPLALLRLSEFVQARLEQESTA